MHRFDRLLVATCHPALLQALTEAGAVAAGSVVEVDRYLTESEPLGLLVAQDLPGLSPDAVRRWAAERPGRVALWLEPDPPPAWRDLDAAVVRWYGELDEATLADWVAALGDLPAFEAGWRIGGLLGMRGGLGTTTRALLWARKLYALHGPGLLVDADWDCPGLTAAVSPGVWLRGSSATFATASPTLVRCRGGWLVPAPAPWNLAPPDVAREDVERLTDAHPGWAVVDLGRDPRRPVAARWLARCDHLVVVAPENDGERLTRTLALLRELNPAARIGVATAARGWRRTLPEAIVLPVDWPLRSPATLASSGVVGPDGFSKGGILSWARRLPAAFNPSGPRRIGPSRWATWRRRWSGPSKTNILK